MTAVPATVDRVQFERTGLVLSGELSFDEWASIGETLNQMQQGILWWVGDWVRYGENRYGEKYAQIIDVTRYDYQTINGAAWVASRFEFIRRRTNLSWSHHKEVAALEPTEADRWLERAEKEGWSHKALRVEVKAASRKRIAGIAAAKLPDTATVAHAHYAEFAESLPDESVSLVFTDPPYSRDFVPDYGRVAEIAARVLVPGGSLVCYAGQYLLADLYSVITPHLRPWWVLAAVHGGRLARMTEYGIVVGWKPLLWFVKGTRGDKHTFLNDVTVGQREKEHHPWQQDEAEAVYVIEKLTQPGDLVFDPFCGSGTTGVAALRLGRRIATCDVDPEAVAIATDRIANTT